MNTTAASSGKYANPKSRCDLVMKGGVTSGLVFPRAVLELANSSNNKGGYRLDSIGGTSAGAVAAAFAAAAEYDRGGGGFERLEAVNQELQGGAGATQGTFLRNLFQAGKDTEPLLNVFLRTKAYLAEVKSIDRDSAKRRLRRWLAYARLLRRVVRESGVPGFFKGRAWGAAGGIAVAVVASVACALPWLGTGFGPAFWIILAALAVAFGAAGWWLGGLVGGLAGLYEVLTVAVPKNRFGICSGMPASEPAAHTAATQWIHDSIKKIAGCQEILTFGALEGDRDEADGEQGKTRNKVTLRIMTTNLSEGRPYVLPLDEPFIFRKADFDALFPRDVVKHLTDHARKVRGIDLPSGFHFLPARKDFPVVVAARMSMSFPLFFSSVPLYALPMWARERLEANPAEFGMPPEGEIHCRVSAQERRGARRPVQSFVKELRQTRRWDEGAAIYRPRLEDLIPHWFSDGGIVSNFPIHFFDDWLPEWPTFGVTLRDLPGYLFPEDGDAEDARARKNYLDSIDRWETPDRPESLGRQVHALLDAWAPAAAEGLPNVVLLPQPQQTVSPEWEHIRYPDEEVPGSGAVPNFLRAVVKTMQNYRDNAQAALASYRERVVQVRLRPDEGGFNLDMDLAVIQGVVRKGEQAGQTIDAQFRDEHHQWTRLRVLVAELEEVFRTIRKNSLDTRFQKLVARQKHDAGFPFREPDGAWCADFDKRLDTLRAAMVEWVIGTTSSAGMQAGNPPPELRVTPKM